MATQSEIEEIQIQEATELLPVHTDPSDLQGKAVIVYNRQTGQPIAFDATSLAPSGGIPEAPNDGYQYSRRSLAWITAPFQLGHGSNSVEGEFGWAEGARSVAMPGSLAIGPDSFAEGGIRGAQVTLEHVSGRTYKARYQLSQTYTLLLYYALNASRKLYIYEGGVDYENYVSLESVTLDAANDNVAIVTETALDLTQGYYFLVSAYGAHSHKEASGMAVGTDSHAEGQLSLAQGLISHAEGSFTIAGGDFSHAEGSDCKAEGKYAHTEGLRSIASGAGSHAEGQNTIASGSLSHSEGSYTQATNRVEHAQGQYNKSNSASATFGHEGNTIHSIGIGDAEGTRRNAEEVMQNGDKYLYGIGGYDGTNAGVNGNPRAKTIQNVAAGFVSFDISFTDGKFILPSGSVGTDGYYACTGFLPCFPGATIKYRSDSDNEWVSAIAFYDRNKTFISNVHNVGPRILRTAQAPENAYFARMTVIKDEKNLTVYNCIGLLENIRDSLFGLEKQTVGQDVYESTNYMLFAETYTNKIINNVGGIEEDPINQRNCTSRVYLDRDKDLFINSAGNAEAHFFAEDGSYISKVEGYIDNPIFKNSFPANAYYVAFVYFRETGRTFYAGTVNTRYFCRNLFPTVLKKKGTRPVVNIYSTDNEEEIFIKLVDAFYTRDCDVYFENGIYDFDEIYGLMKTKYGWNSAYEMPLGGNCRYYLNGSTITGTYTGSDTDIQQNASVFGTHREFHDDTSFEISGGTIIAENIVYGIHDELSMSTKHTVHKYKDLTILYVPGDHTQSLSKCIGGGLGASVSVNIDNCIFNMGGHSAEDVSYHGDQDASVACHSEIRINNSYFTNTFGSHNMFANQTAMLLIAGCSLRSLATSMARWTFYVMNNTLRG